jgi:hypothetical protein
MQPLTLDDLLPLDEYVGRRPELLAAQARYLDRYRRVRIGPQVTLVFANRQTLWFHVQELLRVARLADPPRVQQELDSYNRLLPGRGQLQAAMMLDIPEGPAWAERVRFWQDLAGENMILKLGEGTVSAQLTTSRPEDRCAGASQWLEFTLTAADRRALADGRQPVCFAVEHKTYQHRSALLGEAIRKSLLEDLELSDRDRAA